MEKQVPEKSLLKHPQVGMLATVRNRHGVITSVDPQAGPKGDVLNLVTVEYLDGEGVQEDSLLWELELGTNLLEPNVPPDPSRLPPMLPGDYDSLTRATRWTAMTPFVDPDGSDGPLSRLPVSAPLHGAIQVEDFQLVPLVLALQMPRVSLLLADDVGLGKTIEAGLILSELIQRRRIRRVLIATPASLCLQWQEELRAKFSLDFDVVNRDSTHALRKRLGMDANPWRVLPRVITSYYYLKQPDVLEQFQAASQVREDSPHLPWDLLIVDEAHNLSPPPIGPDTALSEMLVRTAPLFEHKLFLTATPHNGHTRSFSGLLERLDPVRFSQTSELSRAERERIEEVVVRRLKSEINAQTQPPRFCTRHVRELPLALSAEELQLSAAFQVFRRKLQGLIASGRRGTKLAGDFAIEVLGKRLLSCPVTFADTWWRCRQGMAEPEVAEDTEVVAAKRNVEEDTEDDREGESRNAQAVTVVGAWMQPYVSRLENEIAAVDEALASLHLGADQAPDAKAMPTLDARYDALEDWVGSHLLSSSGGLREDERLIIFTEYKTSLDYLARRLSDRHPVPGTLRVLFGGMDFREREDIKAAFNDPHDPVRILVATDTGSEGQNLQETARYLLHFDVPWNPSRLEQRNGRLDRHGQARDVEVFHFTSEDDADLRFLGYVFGKVDQIREDLGSVGEVFDAALQRRLVEGDDYRSVIAELDERLSKAKGRAEVPRAKTASAGADADHLKALEALKAELDLDAGTLKDTLDTALGVGVGGGTRLEGPDGRGRFRLLPPVPRDWEPLVDDTLRLRASANQMGAMRGLTFDPEHFVQQIGGRPVFRPQKDTCLLHLGHPLFHHALATFARYRFPGAAEEREVSRWTVRCGPVPKGADAVLLLTVEELALNELREAFHHWVRTFEIPIVNGDLCAPLPHRAAVAMRAEGASPSETLVDCARALWDEVSKDVRALLASERDALTQRLTEALQEEYDQARADEQARFQSRQGELSRLIAENTIRRLEREVEKLKQDRAQGVLFDQERRLSDIDANIRVKEEEVARRQEHYSRLREQLDRERKRVLEHLLPRRYQLRGKAQVFPVTVELRLPEGGQAA